MRQLIIWLYAKCVFMPHMRSLPHDMQRWEYMCTHGIQLIDDIEMLDSMLGFDPISGKPTLSVVEG